MRKKVVLAPAQLRDDQLADQAGTQGPGNQQTGPEVDFASVREQEPASRARDIGDRNGHRSEGVEAGDEISLPESGDVELFEEGLEILEIFVCHRSG